MTTQPSDDTKQETLEGKIPEVEYKRLKRPMDVISERANQKRLSKIKDFFRNHGGKIVLYTTAIISLAAISLFTISHIGDIREKVISLFSQPVITLEQNLSSPTTLPTTMQQYTPQPQSGNSTISQDIVNQLALYGKTSVTQVGECISKAHQSGFFQTASKNSHVPAGALIATNFGEAGKKWSEFPLTPICYNGDWGLFESTGEFTIPYDGAYWMITPSDVSSSPTPIQPTARPQSTPTQIQPTKTQPASSTYGWKLEKIVSENHVTLNLSAGDVVYLSGSHFSHGGTLCNNSNQSYIMCVYVYQAAKNESITINYLVPHEAWVGITDSLTIDDAIAEKEPMWWRTPNCGNGCTVIRLYKRFADGTKKYEQIMK